MATLPTVDRRARGLLADKQEGNANLTAIAGLTLAADKYIYATGAGAVALGTITTFGRSLVDDADATAARSTLGLGSAAVKATGTSGNVVPLLDGANSWSAGQDIQGLLRCDSFRIDVTPTAETITCTHTITISVDGTNYKIPLVAA